MSNTVRYSAAQQQQQQQQQQQKLPASHSTLNPHHKNRRRHFQVSPAPTMINLIPYTNQRVNTSTPKHLQYQTPIATPLPISNQSSAYFLDRLDIEDYSIGTLKDIVENLLVTMISKGLKVKLSLEDEDFIIDNVADPNQSWILKKSELLYFWRDQATPNILVIVTRRRSRRSHSNVNQPFSASIFRLRNLDASQNFLQKAQQFFTKLSSSASQTNLNYSNGQSTSERTFQTLPNKSRTKKPPLSIYDSAMRSSSIEPPITTPIRLITRAEFDPGKSSIPSEDVRPTIESIQSRRTLSETTTTSTDSRSTGSTKEILSFTKKLNENPFNGRHHDEDEDDKMTTISNQLSGEYVAELLRELKELRLEINALKIDRRTSSTTRSISTSPIFNCFKQTKDSSTSPSFREAFSSPVEVDAETQTDFHPLPTRRRNLLKKNKKTMIGSNNIASMKHQTSFQKSYSSSSVNTGSEPDESTQESSSQLNESSNDSTSVRIPSNQPIVLAAPPRPMLNRNPINSTLSLTRNSSNEEGSFSHPIPIMIEKEMTQFLSNNFPPSSSFQSEFVRIPPPPPPPPVLPSTNSRFSIPFINPLPVAPATQIPLTEHIYENVPTLMQTLANQRTFFNNNEDQQQITPFTQSNGISYLLPEQVLSNSPPSKEINPLETIDPVPTQKPQIISAGRHRSQPVYFANHLTNPLFNVDKQLLINTIANQFGVDLNSPQLQNLVSNQHLFVAKKRTFANMVWQMTADEESALCSSPISSSQGIIDVDAIETDSTNNTRPILKANNLFPSTGKRRNITWDNTID